MTSKRSSDKSKSKSKFYISFGKRIIDLLLGTTLRDVHWFIGFLLFGQDLQDDQDIFCLSGRKAKIVNHLREKTTGSGLPLTLDR